MKKNLFRVISLVIAISMLTVCVFALVSCDDKDTANDKAFSEDKYYSLDVAGFNIMGLDVESLGIGDLVEMILPAVINMDETYFVFKADGTCHLQLVTAYDEDTQEGALSTIKGLLLSSQEAKDTLATTLEAFDLKGGIQTFVGPMFPGFEEKLIGEKDLYGALGLIKESLGIYIDGLDVENEDVKYVLNYMSVNYALPGDLVDRIPSDTVLKLTLDTGYRLVQEVSEVDGTTKNLIYLGNAVANNDKTQPFGIFEIKDNKISLRLEVLNTTLGFKERA